MRCNKRILLEDHLRCRKEKARAGKGKEAHDEKMTKCYKLSMSNERLQRYLNTTRYEWCFISMLWFSFNIG